MAQTHQKMVYTPDPLRFKFPAWKNRWSSKALRDKRAEIHGQIAVYQAQIAQVKHDVAHVNATIRMFTDVECQRTRYVVSHGFFKKGEIADLCVLHLRQDSQLTTRELAERVMCERGLDAKDATLRNSVVFKVVQSLRHAARRKSSLWWRNERACASGLLVPPLRCALPIALPEAADWCGQSVADHGVSERSIAPPPVIF